MASGGAVVVRHAARVLLLDPAERILLLRLAQSADGGSWWITPGGGVWPGETREAAALRELAEETGKVDAELGCWCMAFRQSRVRWGAEHARLPARSDPARPFLRRVCP